MLRLLLLCCLFTGIAKAASFNCSKAYTKVEKMICSNSKVSELDSHLAKIYKLNLSKISTKYDKQVYRAEQFSWLKKVRDVCNDTSCLFRVYSERIAALTNIHKITAIGVVNVGTLDSGIGDEAGFLTDSAIGNKIFNVCKLQDVCQVTGTVDENGWLITVDEVKLLRSSD